MRADLHMHTVCSDGSLTPLAAAERASAAGVRLFSVTDHDTLAGNAEGAAAAKKLGLRFVRGMEVSAYLGMTKVHVLGYGCREGEEYGAFLQARVSGARERARDSVRKANEYFSLDVTLEEVERFHLRKEAPLHTMHVVKAYAARLGTDEGKLYREVFGPARPAFSGLCRPSPTDAVRLIHAMGGKASLAHPAQILVLPEEVSARFHSYRPAAREAAKRRYSGARLALMEELCRAGLDGIECFHPTHTAEETEEFLAFAKAHGLFVTGGSDFHADGTKRRIGMPVFDAEETAELLLALDGSI